MDFLRQYWPQLMSFMILVTIFIRMRVDIDVLKEKVKTLFELWNKEITKTFLTEAILKQVLMILGDYLVSSSKNKLDDKLWLQVKKILNQK